MDVGAGFLSHAVLRLRRDAEQVSRSDCPELLVGFPPGDAVHLKVELPCWMGVGTDHELLRRPLLAHMKQTGISQVVEAGREARAQIARTGDRRGSAMSSRR